ncbi:uncharacterized protein EV422DRAFT_517686 [Fimicolochytrium jonesii]|uniref:uncharacterized protein n=1 Tax=Fimicolochytrium jonesii TaxID=1396493 RepID=UPI0022FEE386|nr:uncharacterized protein EV422DRAFT_517686 [Fimicolochytrium jonesii]KAI8825162.1 hypothetical protein EV422DRAFT_517686 [Fimicolochytrium jonesii]
MPPKRTPVGQRSSLNDFLRRPAPSPHTPHQAWTKPEPEMPQQQQPSSSLSPSHAPLPSTEPAECPMDITESATTAQSASPNSDSQERGAGKRKAEELIDGGPVDVKTDLQAPAEVESSGTTPVIAETRKSTRKKQKLDKAAPSQASSSASAEVKPPFHVDIKKGKVVFSEKKVNFERHPSTITDLASFFQWKEDLPQGEALSVFPPLFHSLVARYVEESHLELDALASHIKDALCPPGFGEDSPDDGEVLSADVIATAVQSLAARRNYGVCCNNISPPNLAVWRWEVQNMSLFPPELATTVDQRRQKRILAASALNSIFKSLPKSEKDKIAPPPATTAKAAPALAIASTPRAKQDAKQEAKEREKQKKAAEKAAEKLEKERRAAEKLAEKAAEKAEKDRKGAERKAERELKEAERKAEREKKDAIKRAQKDAEDAEKSKQKSIAGFFTKVQREEVKPAPPVKVVSETKAFWEYFPPFHAKDNITVAPYNRFPKPSAALLAKLFPRPPPNVSLPKFSRAPSTSAKSTLPADVMDIVHANGDGSVKTIPAEIYRYKLLQFAGDLRPPYWGTWTKTSKVINGRRPFARDTVTLDYDYDSEAEWEEDGPGEELVSEADDDSEAESTADAAEEEDNWLVPHGYLSDDEGLEKDEEDQSAKPRNAPAPASPTSVLARKGKERGKWGVLAALVPDIRGPFFSTDLESGESSHPLSQYTAQSLLPDVSMNISPFHVQKDPPDGSGTPVSDATEAQGKKSLQPSAKKPAFPQDRLVELKDAISGKSTGISKLVEELKVLFADVPKTQLDAKIREIAVKEKRTGDRVACWYLKDAPAQQGNSTSALAPVLTATPRKLKASPSIKDMLSPHKAHKPAAPTSTYPRSTPNSPASTVTQNILQSPCPPNSATSKLAASIVASSYTSTETSVPSTTSIANPPAANAPSKVDDRMSLATQTLQSSASTDPQRCLSVLPVQELVTASHGILPDELMTAILDVAAKMSVQAELRSRCLRVLGNQVTELEKGFHNAQLRTAAEATYTSLATNSKLFVCIDSNLVPDPENGSPPIVVKNMLRLLLALVQVRADFAKRTVESLNETIATRWLPKLLTNLESAPVEMAGFAVGLVDSCILTAAPFDPQQLWSVLDALRPQLGKKEMYQKGPGVRKDKYFGVKKYAVKAFEKILQRGECRAVLSLKTVLENFKLDKDTPAQSIAQVNEILTALGNLERA